MQTHAAPHSTDTLWTAARAAFAHMCDAIGDAGAIVLWTLKQAHRRRASAVLRPLENFVRQLIMIEALERPPERAKPRPVLPAARAAQKQKRRYAFRLWSRPRAHPARIRLLGRPTLMREIWRENARAAAAERLAAARLKRTLPFVRLARRIDALARVLERPNAAIARLARKLRKVPRLALKIAVLRVPREACIDQRAQTDLALRAFKAAARTGADTS